MKTLETDNLILRKFEIEDAERAYYNWAGVPEIAEMSDFRVHSSKEETKIMIQLGMGEEDEDMYTYAISLKENNEPIGFARIYQISNVNRTCKMYWILGKKWWNKGISLEALKSIVKYLFEVKDYNIVICEYYSKMDKWYKKILEELGMYKEAILRKRKVDASGDFQDKIVYSMTKDEYIKINKG